MNAGSVTTNTQANGYFAVVEKFKNRQTVDKNSDKEVKFFDRYFDITDNYLNEFFAHSLNEANYVNSVEDVSMKNNLDALYNYLLQHSF